MNRHVYLEPTEEGSKLTLTSEQEHLCKIVYKRTGSTETLEEKYSFHCLWDPEQDYDDDCIIVPFRSSFDKFEIWDKDKIFSNVLGSSGDKPEIGRVWFGFYVSKVKEYYPDDPEYWKEICSSDGFFYNPAGGIFDWGACGQTMVGGHVVEGPKAKDPTKDGSDVYIVPLCSRHNSMGCTPESNGNGDGFYMRMSSKRPAMKLSDYKLLPKYKADTENSLENAKQA